MVCYPFQLCINRECRDPAQYERDDKEHYHSTYAGGKLLRCHNCPCNVVIYLQKTVCNLLMVQFCIILYRFVSLFVGWVVPDFVIA